MKVFDRILNKYIPLSEIESPIVLGRYIFTSDVFSARLNGRKIKKGDFLVPCNVTDGLLKTNSDETKLIFKENELLNENLNSLVKHTLLEITEELGIIDDYSELKEINILLRNLDDKLELSEFEKLLHKNLFHIEEVCRDPSYHLKRETIKVNIARAKRVPVKAINYLAAHTEDWSRRRIRSVEPRKILSEIIDYDLEIYENRITSSFIDELLIYFSHRMVNEIDVIDKFVQNIENILESRKRINSNKKIFWYKKLNRDYEKLGTAIKSIENSRVKIEKIRAFIQSLQMRLFGLLKSDLYLATSNKKNTANQQLKRTNLFDNHQHYRFVKILWNNFFKKEQKNCTQKSQNNQDAIKSYVDYSWIIIIRSLQELGFTVNNFNTKSLKLTHNGFNVSLQLIKNEQQIINVVLDSNKEFTFIPIPSAKYFLGEKMNTPPNNYYFALNNIQKETNILEISPTNINSEESISRIIFRELLELFAKEYYYKLDSQSISKFRILTEWLKKNTSLTLDRGKDKKIDFWLKRKINTNEIKQLSEVIKNQKNNLSAQTDIQSQELKKLKEIENTLKNNSAKHFEKYNICIKCNCNQSSSLKSNNDGFRYICDNKDCNIEYGFNIKNEINIFYKVPDFKLIEANIKKSGKEINNILKLNAFGYENI